MASYRDTALHVHPDNVPGQCLNPKARRQKHDYISTLGCRQVIKLPLSPLHYVHKCSTMIDDPTDKFLA